MGETSDKREPWRANRRRESAPAVPAIGYVPHALEARRIPVVCAAAAVALAGCGGGERQDENEPEGSYRVDVTQATFPGGQKLAKPSTMRIVVKNVDDQTVPNIAVTVRGFDERVEGEDLADPERPVFAINGEPEQIGGLPESRAQAPRGGDTAYVDTWALGELAPGQVRTFLWKVTAVEAGPYRLTYEVSAGLDGKAKAVTQSGRQPTGVFIGTIDDTPPDARVADDGRTIIRDDESE